MTLRTMLITGATGFIGSRLATLACSQGYSVKSLTRRNWDNEPAVPVERRYFCDLPGQIPIEALEGVNVVVHCAAAVTWSERSVHAINTEGTTRLAELAARTGVESFIFLSSQSARPDALSIYGRTKYAAEQSLQQVEGINVIILRPGLVTGPGSRGLFQRMTKMVDSLPVIPLLGGGKSIVQPIHVDDLCQAIFRCDQEGSKLHRRILHLGQSDGVPLVEFLRAIAEHTGRRRKLMLPIPLWLAEFVVSAAELAGIPLPVNSNNLKGLKATEKMETTADIDLLKLNLRPLQEAIRSDTQPVRTLSLTERSARILLIGAGRVGLVHAITLSRLPGVVLCGVVDPSKRATSLLRGIGISVPIFKVLKEAVDRTRPDAAIIATPAATHLPLTCTCLELGLAVLVEKPLALCKRQLAEYECLPEKFPSRTVQVGYVLLRNPHVAFCLSRLREGRYGRVTGFLGFTAVSFIQESRTNRWEVKKGVSGGGALINAGSHVLAMMRAAFGDPKVVKAEHLRLYSTEVEDSMAITLTYPEFEGMHYCCWSMKGYPRQNNTLSIWTDRGRLILTNSMGVFIHNDGLVDITHQLDFDVGFNMAPDYGGAGFTIELQDLRESIVTGRTAPVDLNDAIKLERLLFRIYENSGEVVAFSSDQIQIKARTPEGFRIRGSTEGNASGQIQRVLDLRDLSLGDVQTYFSASVNSAWDGYLFGPAQIKTCSTGSFHQSRFRVTVPDFLNQSRLLSIGRYADVLKQMGASGVLAAARAAAPLLMSERSPTFWVAAMGLLGAALHGMPPQFEGTLLLHAYLTDMALNLRMHKMLERMLLTCRKASPRARIGFHTNIASEAANALRLMDVPVHEVSMLASPMALNMASIMNSLRDARKGENLKLTAEVGQAPAVVHRIAFNYPEQWAFGAEALVIGIYADEVLTKLKQGEHNDEWRKVFPNLVMPKAILS